MTALLEHSPDIYLDEIQEQLAEQHNISVSLASISRTLKRLGISSKKVCLFTNFGMDSYPHAFVALSSCS